MSNLENRSKLPRLLRAENRTIHLPGPTRLNLNSKLGILSLEMMDIVTWTPPGEKPPSFLPHAQAQIAMSLLNDDSRNAKSIYEKLIWPFFVNDGTDSEGHKRGLLTDAAQRANASPGVLVGTIKGYADTFKGEESSLTASRAMNLVLGTSPDKMPILAEGDVRLDMVYPALRHLLVAMLAITTSDNLWVQIGVPTVQIFTEIIQALKSNSKLIFPQYDNRRDEMLGFFSRNREALIPLIPSWFALEARAKLKDAEIEGRNPNELVDKILSPGTPNYLEFVTKVKNTGFDTGFETALFYSQHSLPYPADTMLKAAAAEMVRGMDIEDVSSNQVPHPSKWMEMRDAIGKPQLEAVKTVGEKNPHLALLLASPALARLFYNDIVIPDSKISSNVRDTVQYAALGQNLGGNGPAAAVLTEGLWHHFGMQNQNVMIREFLSRAAYEIQKNESPEEPAKFSDLEKLTDKDRLQMSSTRTAFSDIVGLSLPAESWVASFVASFDNGYGTGYIKHVAEKICGSLIGNNSSADKIYLLEFLSSLTYSEAENRRQVEGYVSALRSGAIDPQKYGEFNDVMRLHFGAFRMIKTARDNMQEVKRRVSVKLLDQQFENPGKMLLTKEERKLSYTNGAAFDYPQLLTVLTWLTTDIPESHEKIIECISTLLERSGLEGRKQHYNPDYIKVLVQVRENAQQLIDHPTYIHSVKSNNLVSNSNLQGIVDATNNALYKLAKDVVINNISLANVSSSQTPAPTNGNGSLEVDETFANNIFIKLDDQSLSNFLAVLIKRLTHFEGRIQQSGGESWQKQDEKSPSRRVADVLTRIASKTIEETMQRKSMFTEENKKKVRNLKIRISNIISTAEKLDNRKSEMQAKVVLGNK